MKTKQEEHTEDRTFDSESDLRRYQEGYDRGLTSPATWHPYFGWDMLFAMGGRDAQRDFRPGTSNN